MIKDVVRSSDPDLTGRVGDRFSVLKTGVKGWVSGTVVGWDALQGYP